jgi:hypothetical protein
LVLVQGLEEQEVQVQEVQGQEGQEEQERALTQREQPCQEEQEALADLMPSSSSSFPQPCALQRIQ